MSSQFRCEHSASCIYKIATTCRLEEKAIANHFSAKKVYIYIIYHLCNHRWQYSFLEMISITCLVCIPIHMQLPSFNWQRWSSCTKHWYSKTRNWSRSWRRARLPLSRCVDYWSCCFEYMGTCSLSQWEGTVSELAWLSPPSFIHY